MSFEWENGRILKKINTSDKSVQMSYDSNGMRTQKTVDGVKTNYYYDSNKNLIALVKGNDTLLFYYDSDGSATSFSYNGTMYFYVKNLQGDVVRIIDLAGTEVASYVYDAWGNIKDTKGEPTIREINPIRYRSYVYDTETSLYYLQSRYYDPFTGRFLNADVIISANSINYNLFTYCENNCISCVELFGFASKKLKYPGEIHTQVQRDMLKRFSKLKMEQQIKYKDGSRGRADLLNIKSGSIWEVKPVSTKYSTAKKQIDKYVTGKWVNYRDSTSNLKLKIGGKFKGNNFYYKDYLVEYWYDTHGIVRYRYYEVTHNKPSNSNNYKWLVVGGVCVLVIVCVVAAPATGGASLGGIAFVP